MEESDVENKKGKCQNKKSLCLCEEVRSYFDNSDGYRDLRAVRVQHIVVNDACYCCASSYHASPDPLVLFLGCE